VGFPAIRRSRSSRFSDRQSEALAGHALEQAGGEAYDLAEIVRTAEGNPLFIEELAASISERGAEQELPHTIRTSVSARLDALPPAEREVVLDASVVGKIFWRGALEHMGVGG